MDIYSREIYLWRSQEREEACNRTVPLSKVKGEKRSNINGQACFIRVVPEMIDERIVIRAWSYQNEIDKAQNRPHQTSARPLDRASSRPARFQCSKPAGA